MRIEVVKTRVFHTQAKYVEQEKPSLNAAVGFKPAHYETAAARIEKVGGTQGFVKTLHTDLRYNMWWWHRKEFLRIVVGSRSATPETTYRRVGVPACRRIGPGHKKGLCCHKGAP